MSFKGYLDKAKLRELCTDISMPEEAAVYICGPALEADFSSIEQYFDKLFSLKTGSEATRAIDEWGSENHGLKGLAAYLIAALKSRELCRELKIGDDIFVDTMKAFSRFVREHHASYGCCGYDRGFWTNRQICLNLLRLGCLEFEMLTLHDGDLQKRMGAGAPQVLSVHIPSDAVMTRENLDSSYTMAKEFFPRVFPGFDYKLMYCSTWLLAPALSKMLPPGSKILEFQADYEILEIYEDGTSCMGWVFKKKYDNYSDLPEDTSLMRAIKAHLLSGGKVGEAMGVVRGSRK